MKSNFRLVKSGLNVQPLLDDLRDWSHLFDKHTARQETPGSPHVDTKTIFLRWSKELSVDTVFTDLVAVDYPEIDCLYHAKQVILEVMKHTKAEKLGRVIIVSLKPGGQIPEHVDEGDYADHYERFHVCLASDAGNLFYNEKEAVYMRPGQIWHFNHKKPHKVENKSLSERIHLIVDLVSSKYRGLRLSA